MSCDGGFHFRISARSDSRQAAIGAALEKSDDRSGGAGLKGIPLRWIRDYFRPIKRRAQLGGVSHLAAKTASNAAIENSGDRILS
jgi:hypothetical protein